VCSIVVSNFDNFNNSNFDQLKVGAVMTVCGFRVCGTVGSLTVVFSLTVDYDALSVRRRLT
jgi:hypothetical protein